MNKINVEMFMTRPDANAPYTFKHTNSTGASSLSDSRQGMGNDNGITPFQMLLSGLAGCTSIDVVMIFAKKRKNLKDIQVNINAVQDGDGKKKWYESITLDFILYSDDISEEEAKTVIEMSLDEYCSVAHTLKNAGIKIDYTLQIKK